MDLSGAKFTDRRSLSGWLRFEVLKLAEFLEAHGPAQANATRQFLHPHLLERLLLVYLSDILF